MNCAFRINKGIDTQDFASRIIDLGSEKLATVSMTSVFSKEFEGLFLNEDISIILDTIDGVKLEFTGEAYGNLVIGFSYYTR